MKKFISLFSIAATFVAISCEKSNLSENSGSTLVFSSEKPALINETKTHWDGSSILWSEGDAIRVAYTRDGVWQNNDGTAPNGLTPRFYQSDALTASGRIGKFKVPQYFKDTNPGVYQYYGIYPHTATPTDIKDAPSATVNIISSQSPKENSFDPSADLMLGQAVTTYESRPTQEISMSWQRLVAHAQLTFTSINGMTEGESIKSITLTANPEAELVGEYNLNLITKEISKSELNTTPNVLTLGGSNLSATMVGTGYNIVTWAAFLPATITSLKVEINSDKATYTRDITGINKTFAGNARNILNIDMSTATRTEISSNLVRYYFNEIDFSSWRTSYEYHRVEYDEATVTFSYASKQSSTSAISDIPVTKAGSMTIVLKNGKTMNSYKLECRQWASKEKTITVDTSTNGGSTWNSTGLSSTNFTLSASDIGTTINAVRFNFIGSNQVGINALEINLN